MHIELHLTAFEAPFRSVFRRNELDELYNAMHEKEHRVIVDVAAYKNIDELDFGMDDMNIDEDEQELGPADEAFRDVIDRQRLMPY